MAFYKRRLLWAILSSLTVGTVVFAVLFFSLVEAAPTTFSKRVDASSDDCHRRADNGQFILDGINGSPGDFSSTIFDYSMGVRFTGLPNELKDATIVSAKLTLKEDYKDASAPTEYVIDGEKATSPVTFVDTGDYDARVRTTATVPWEPAVWEPDQVYDTPDLTSVVEEILTVWDGTSSSMVFFLRDSPGWGGVQDRIGIVSWDGDTATAPYLTIVYIPASGGDSEVYEYYNTNDDWFNSINSPARPKAQTFTPVEEHVITSVELKLHRSGTPTAWAQVGIREVDGENKPTGDDLVTSSAVEITNTSPGTWYEFDLGDGTPLLADTRYAIILRRTSGTATLYWWWDESSPLYTRGESGWSEDSGSTWTMESSKDYMFEDWGELPPEPTPTPTSTSTPTPTATFTPTPTPTPTPPSDEPLWYVDSSVSASGSGESWSTAFKTIPEAVAAAAVSEIIEVGSGSYSSLWDEAPIQGGFLVRTSVGEDETEFIVEGSTFALAKEGTGTPVVGASVYGSTLSFTSLPEDRVTYFDIYVNNASGVTSIQFEVSFSVSELGRMDVNLDTMRPYWFDGVSWSPISDYTWSSGTRTLVVLVNDGTSPSLAQLTGTIMGAGGDPVSQALINMGNVLPIVLLAVYVISLVALTATGKLDVPSLVIAAVAGVMAVSFAGLISEMVSGW